MIWRESSTASSYTTYYATTTRWLTNSQKPHQVKAWFPTGFFVSDQHHPFVGEEGEKPPEESEPEVMAIDQPPEVNLEDPDW
jgi:hypothetical protein